MSTSNAEIRISWLNVVIAAAGFAFGVYQYSSQSGKNLKEQFNRELWMQKKEVYTNLCNVLGSVAAGSASEADHRMEVKKFSALYYGNMALITDNDRSIDSCLTAIVHTLFQDFRFVEASDQRVLSEQVRYFGALCRESLKRDLDDL